MVYVDLICTKAALIRSDYPDTNYHGAAKYRMCGPDISPNDSYLLLEFESLPSEYHYRSIYGASLNITCSKNAPSTKLPMFYWSTLESAFDQNTVTWNSRPLPVYNSYNGGRATSGTGDELISIPVNFSDIYGMSTAEAAYTVLNSPAFRLDYSGSSLTGSYYADVYTDAAASGKKPFLRITLSDDNASVTVSKNNVNGATNSRARFACNKQSVFSWSLKLTSGYTYADIVQDSARLHWRKKGNTSWNNRSYSGNSTSVTVPADVFPAADIEWAVTPVCGSFRMIAAGTDYYTTAYPRYFAELTMTGAAITQSHNPDTTVAWDSSGANSIYHYYQSGTNFQNDAYMMFSEMPSALGRRAIEAAAIRHDHSMTSGWSSYPELYALKTAFAPERITWKNAPTVSDKLGSVSFRNIANTIRDAFLPLDTSIFPVQSGISGSYYRNGSIASTTKDISLASRDILRAAALKISMPPGTWNNKTYSGFIFGNPAPVLVAMLLDETVTSTVEGQTLTAGYVNPHAAQTFEWDHVPAGDYACAGTWDSVSATFYWSDGTSSHTVAVQANSKSVTLPANTLPVGTITWYVTATDDQGTTSTSPTYTITTEDSETTANPKAPIQTVEDARTAIVFRWETVNDHGTPPTGADLQISTDGTTWTDLGSVSGDVTEFTATADTLPSGTVYWRVRAYNTDGTVGSWSEAVNFVAINAPEAPIVTADAVPFATIRWQADGQQAFRITVDGTTYGPFFGSAKSYTLDDYLGNGGHTVSVEIQGSTGLWSKPGTVTFSVENVSGTPIQLAGVFYRDAELQWTSGSESDDFLIYRDGVRIAHTRGSSFTDRTVLGVHSWQVINRLPGGYYTPSNLVQGELKSCGTAIALLNGGEWLDLKKTDSESNAQGISVSQQISLRHFEGSIYPEAEIGPYIDQTGSYLVAWTYDEQEAAAAFEAMLGRPVILKARGNECTVGIMMGYSKNLQHFYKAYTFTLHRIHWEDFIDEDD